MPSDMELFDPFRKKKGFAHWMDDFFEPIRMGKDNKLKIPLINIADKGKLLQIVAELPRVEKKDIDVNITKESIEIRTGTKAEKEEINRENKYYLQEHAYTGFYRRLPLPSTVIAEKAKAEFKNGILRIDIPKKTGLAHPKKGRHLEIK